MSDSEIFVQFLRNRIRAVNTVWPRAIADMTLAQVNHHERDGVLPIAFSFSQGLSDAVRIWRVRAEEA